MKRKIYFLSLAICLTIHQSARAQKMRPYDLELFPKGISGAVCGFLDEGKTILIVREDTLEKKLFIYEAKKTRKGWGRPMLVNFSGKYNDMGGRLTPNGSIFYFTSDRPGGSDNPEDTWNIWFVRRLGNSWGRPQPLTEINNKGSECCPAPIGNSEVLFSSARGPDVQWQIFSWKENDDRMSLELSEKTAWQWPSYYSEEEGILFFNSMKRADSKGKDDIYVSIRKNGQWLEPQNLGDIVNSEFYEDGAILSPDRKYLIFNRHETSATPSEVLMIKWEAVLRKISK